MSVWYNLHVYAFAKNKAAVAKFFNLEDSSNDIRTCHFEFSFGGKNGPGLNFAKIVEQNPDIVFLVKENIECETQIWFLTKFDKESNEQLHLYIQDFGLVENKLSKKILDEYQINHPGLAIKHLNGEEGYEYFRWSYEFPFEKAEAMLKNADEYREMVDPWEYLKVKQYSLTYECIDEPSYAHTQTTHLMSFGEANKFLAKLKRTEKKYNIRNIVMNEFDHSSSNDDLEFGNLPLDE